MPGVAEETAYYFNIEIPAVALIAKGVRFPAGSWSAIADASALTWRIEEALAELFPGLKGTVVRFETLTSEFEVKEFERSLLRPP
jgi:phytoene dehydrogenase-like protein